jgi:hypothetical protein
VSPTVSSGDVRHEILPGSPVTFGRSETCAIVLDHADATISRVAGQIEVRDGRYWVVNHSRQPLGVRDHLGLLNKVLPGHEYALVGPSTILVSGSARRHVLTADVPTVQAPPRPDGIDGQPTDIGDEVVVREDDRKALVALFAGYMEPPPRYRPAPRTYEAAARRLGWPRTKLIRRIEYLRRRLTDAGVPDLNGPDALANLAEFVLANGTVGPADLERYPHLRHPAGSDAGADAAGN